MDTVDTDFQIFKRIDVGYEYVGYVGYVGFSLTLSTRNEICVTRTA